MSVRILIDVPNIIRDGVGLCYLKVLLERKGYKVKIVDSAKDTILTVLSFKPHVAVLGNISEVRGSSITKYVRSIGGKIIILPTEGLVSNLSGMFPKKFIEDYNAVTDLWLCWGSHYAEAIKTYLGIEEEKIRVCGCPRFDIYKLPLKRIIATKKDFCERYGLDPNKKIITLPTHFVFADTNLDHARGNIFHAEDYSDIVKAKMEDAKYRISAINALKKLARDLPNVNFIVKVHPWGDAEFYLNALKGLSNATVVMKENISDVINASDVWIHVSCTTAKEATFMGKPVLTLALLKKPYYDIDEFTRMCETVNSYEELLRKVKLYLNGKKQVLRKRMRTYIESRLYRIDGKSTQRCANEIERFIENTKIKLHTEFPMQYIGNMIRFDLKSIVRYVIYSNNFLRNIYLKARWSKSEEYLKFVKEEMFSESFEKRLEKIERKILTQARNGMT